jgi:hypothetical protein
MADTYFSAFNVINYANTYAVDLNERTVVLKNAIKNPYLFYPFDITNDVRPDQIAFQAYGDPYTSWAIYMTNDIVDPYYEWYLNDYEFTQFIKDKYGTLEKASTKVAYYGNNWYSDEPITTSAYNALTGVQRGYWDPVYGVGSQIIEYTRKKDDLKYSTNFIMAIGYTGNASFTKDEVINISIDNTSSGRAQFITANSTHCLVQHIYGDAFPHDDIVITANSYMTGTESNANVSYTSCTFVANNIPEELASYYSPVYYIDVETDKNEGNRTIRLLQPNYYPDFYKNFQDLMGA